MSEPQKKNKSGARDLILQLLVGAIAGALLSTVVLSLLKTSGSDPVIPSLEPGWLVAALLLGPVLAIAIHELGHVLAGLSQGFRFCLYIVGPLRVSRTGEQIEIGWNNSLQLAGGIAACLPVETRGIVRGMTVMVAGGPAASVLFAALCAAAALAVDPAAAGPRVTLFATAASSMLIGAATLIPIRSGGFHSDGARLLMALRGGADIERWARSAAVSSLAFSSIRPRDWPAELLQEASTAIDGSLDGVGLSTILFYHAVDRGDWDEAGRHLDHFLANIDAYPPPFRPGLALEGAWFEGAIRQRPAEASAWLDQSSGGVLIERDTRLRAEAAVLAASGRTAEALRKCDEALELLARRRNSTGLARCEESLLERLRAQAAA